LQALRGRKSGYAPVEMTILWRPRRRFSSPWVGRKAHDNSDPDDKFVAGSAIFTL
jgi:hypothetical protein